MALALVTAPATEPVTLAEAKAQCRIDGSTDDPLLTSYILSARTFAENYTRRAMVTQTWDYKVDEPWPRDRHPVTGCYVPLIVLPKPPVQSVTSVTYVDNDGATQTLSTDDWNLVQLESSQSAVAPEYGVIWPSVRRDYACATVRFVCGYGAYTAVPEPIRQAILMMVAHLYANREPVVVGSTVADMPYAIEALLFPYRVFY